MCWFQLLKSEDLLFLFVTVKKVFGIFRVQIFLISYAHKMRDCEVINQRYGMDLNLNVALL